MAITQSGGWSGWQMKSLRSIITSLYRSVPLVPERLANILPAMEDPSSGIQSELVRDRKDKKGLSLLGKELRSDTHKSTKHKPISVPCNFLRQRRALVSLVYAKLLGVDGPQRELTRNTLSELRWGRSVLLFETSSSDPEKRPVVPSSNPKSDIVQVSLLVHYANYISRAAARRYYDPPSSSETDTHWPLLEILEMQIEEKIRHNCFSSFNQVSSDRQKHSRATWEMLYDGGIREELSCFVGQLVPHSSSSEKDNKVLSSTDIMVSRRQAQQYISDTVLADTDLARISPDLFRFALSDLQHEKERAVSSSARRSNDMKMKDVLEQNSRDVTSALLRSSNSKTVKWCVLGLTRQGFGRLALRWAIQSSCVGSLNKVPSLPFSLEAVVQLVAQSHCEGWKTSWIFATAIPPIILSEAVKHLKNDCLATSVCNSFTEEQVVAAAASNFIGGCLAAARLHYKALWAVRMRRSSMIVKKGPSSPEPNVEAVKKWLEDTFPCLGRQSTISTGKQEPPPQIILTTYLEVCPPECWHDALQCFSRFQFSTMTEAHLKGRLMALLRQARQPEQALKLHSTHRNFPAIGSTTPEERSALPCRISHPSESNHGVLALVEVGQWKSALAMYEQLQKENKDNIFTHLGVAKMFFERFRSSSIPFLELSKAEDLYAGIPASVSYQLYKSALQKARVKGNSTGEYSLVQWRLESCETMEEILALWALVQNDYLTIFHLLQWRRKERALVTSQDFEKGELEHPQNLQQNRDQKMKQRTARIISAVRIEEISLVAVLRQTVERHRVSPSELSATEVTGQVLHAVKEIISLFSFVQEHGIAWCHDVDNENGLAANQLFHGLCLVATIVTSVSQCATIVDDFFSLLLPTLKKYIRNSQANFDVLIRLLFHYYFTMTGIHPDNRGDGIVEIGPFHSAVVSLLRTMSFRKEKEVLQLFHQLFDLLIGPLGNTTGQAAQLNYSLAARIIVSAGCDAIIALPFMVS